MFEQMEAFIDEVLFDDAQRNALDFAAYLKANHLLAERGKGYWENQLYWLIKYENEHVCFILIEGPEMWTFWSDDSGTNCFSDFPLDEQIKEIAWRNIDFCANCGTCKCPGGMRKTLFGKPFDSVCITAMKVVNPDTEALKCIKKLVEIRQKDIITSLHRMDVST